ncbi:hypothetical protein LINPERPRIM_LOCUS22825 [Linum perenne]
MVVTGKSFVILLMCWFMALGHNPITCFELSMKEDKRQERPRKLLNKPRVTTIQTKYGELYDCVDFYQQPAFDHPLLKHHKYKYKLITFFQMISSHHQVDDKSVIDPFNIWLNGKGCPSNTVPIKRDTKDDLMRIKNMTTHLARTNSMNEVAVLRTNGKNKYHGGAMAACVYRPKVQSTQYSSSRIIVRNGVDSIAAGWTVNPSLYRDHEPRMFIYTNTKNSHCYNTYCPGFIITRSDTPLDFVLKPQTVIGGPRFEKYFYIGKDTKNGDWVLVIGATRITMGYWPNKIFTNLRNPANYIEWGGEVYSPQGTPPPQMGSGRINRNISETCFARYVSTVNENHDLDRNPKSCTPYRTSNRYNLIDAGYVTVPIVERLILFGGK